MPPSLQTLIDDLDRERIALFEDVDALDVEALTSRPRPGTWSILEILEHLVVAEAVILQGLPAATELIDRRRSLKNRCAFPLVMAILRLGIPVKVPSRRMIPTGQVPLRELRERWDGHLRWIRAYTAGLDPQGEDRAVFLHPVAGPITLAQALRMDQLHLGVHARQIRKRPRPRSPQLG